MSDFVPRISVLMPVFNGAPFVPRAVDSLRAQSLREWELIVVDDGSTDETLRVLHTLGGDSRVVLIRLEHNTGLGGALNHGLERVRSPLVTYLPADDVLYCDHLASLAACLDAHPGASLAFSGVRHHYSQVATGQIEGYPLQLVQVMHRLTADRWMEREELVTDDLERMFWSKLGQPESRLGTGAVTCEWVDHPGQRHKVIQEPEGGVNHYRARHGVQHPLRFHSTVGNPVDEVAHFRRFRERPDTPAAPDGLTILLVGELAYNGERVLALEERGHRLLGLWMPNPYWFNMVGPLPFGHVTDLARADWRREVERIRPDVIYGLLNWQAVPFVHEVLMANPGIPFVWHFKEGPFICLEKGVWPELIDLFTRSDGQIYSSPAMSDWFETVVPGITRSGRSMVLDGDLPRQDWFAGTMSPRLSDGDGDVHTVVPGRPIGLHPWTVGELAEQGIHLHFYGDYTQKQWHSWIAKARTCAPHHLHLHPNVNQDRWVEEFSQYDAGWLHAFESSNGGDIRRANWDDLNYPARMATLAAAGLPMIQRDNGTAAVASDALARDLDIGVFFTSVEELGHRLRDGGRMQQLRQNMQRHRNLFCFDAHADDLIDFFRAVIGSRNSR